jgi:hypothetical protein
MVLIPKNQTSEVLQPGEQPFHFVTSAVSPQRTSVLCRGLFTVASTGRDHFNPGRSQLFVQRVAVIRLVSEQSFRELIYSFSVGSTANGSRERDTAAFFSTTGGISKRRRRILTLF